MSKILVVGALGVVGRACVERYTRAGMNVVGLSRRPPDFDSSAAWVSADLTDAAATRQALAGHRDITQVVYAALNEQPDLVQGWRDAGNAALNTQMLRHLMDALNEAPLEHVTLLQGTKAYGVHTGRPMRVPAREVDAVRDHTNFYFDQEDELRQRSLRQGFRFTIFRPQIVLGLAMGSAMNPVATLGAYAVLAREQGLPLRFPGHPHLLTECTDARLIAEAAEWAWTAPGAHDQSYNIANGDVIVWQTFFEALAREYKLELGEACEVRIADELERQEPLWAQIAQRERLRITSLRQLLGLSAQYADATWASRRPFPVPPIVSTIKLRQHGFHACIDTQECILEHLREMTRLRYLP